MDPKNENATPAYSFTNKQKIKNVSNEVNELGKNMEQLTTNVLPSFYRAVSENFENLSKRVATLELVMDSVAEILGRDNVKNAVEVVRDRQDKDRNEKEAAMLHEWVTKGLVTPTDKAEEGTLVVGVERDKDGKAISPGRVQLLFESIQKLHQDKVRGATAGTTVALTEDNSTFEVLEVYKVVPQTAAPASTDTQVTATPTDAAGNTTTQPSDAATASTDTPPASPTT